MRRPAYRWKRIVVTLLAPLLLLAIPVFAQKLPPLKDMETQTPSLIRHISSMSLKLSMPNLAISAETFDIHLTPPDLSNDDVSRSADSAETALAAHRGTVRLSHMLPQGGLPLVAGKKTEIPLTFDMERLAPGEDVYVVVFAGMRGGLLLEMIPEKLVKRPPEFFGMTIVAPGIELDGVLHTQLSDGGPGPAFTRFNATSTKVFLESELLSGGVSTFAFDAKHFPAHAMLSTKPLRNAVMAFSGVTATSAAQSPEDAQKHLAKLSESMDRESVLTVFNMVFLASALGPERESLRVPLSLDLPNLPFGYDGLVLLPVAVRRDGPKHAVIIADTERMPPLHLPVVMAAGKSLFPNKFVQTELKPDQPEPQPLPELKIEEGDSYWIAAGRETKKLFRVRHGPAPAGAEIYVALQPAVAGTSRVIGTKGDRLISYESTGTFKVNACRTAIGSDFMRLRQNPILVESPSFLFSGLEAARLGRITSPEGGVVEGVVTFTAPATTEKVYDAVRATPLLLVWNELDGSLCARTEFRHDTSIDVPVRHLRFGR